jgi:peptide/nickel transport system ATP-binding protein
MAGTALLEVRSLRTEFAGPAGVVRAVDDVSLTLVRGGVLGLVGESGSGKSMLGRSIIRLIPQAGRIAAGEVLFKGRDVLQMPPQELRRLRGPGIAMVFQDPVMSLNPVLRVDTQMVETILAHRPLPRRTALEIAEAKLALVGIAAPHERLRAYPHQLSGGMRQRVAIAIALCNDPEIIIADEPTTALDVTIQAQILAEVQQMCAQTGVSLLWITHDLGVVAGLAQDISVMYAGRIVESGPVRAVLGSPAHPYTRGLIASTPSQNRRGRPMSFIPGMVPNALALPAGCAFQGRCAWAEAACAAPQRLEGIGGGHSVRCHRAGALEAAR